MMTDIDTAVKIAEDHVGGEITRDGDVLIFHRNITANDMGVLQNRLDIEVIDHSRDGETRIRLERELHFIGVDRNDIRVVNASNKRVALDKIESDEFQDPEHYGTESGLKSHLRDNEVCYL